jgi:hypothetical protein
MTRVPALSDDSTIDARRVDAAALLLARLLARQVVREVREGAYGEEEPCGHDPEQSEEG